MSSNRTEHIRLTSHPAPGEKPRFPIHWGAADPHVRGPIIGTVSQPRERNVIGTHGGSYALYRALAVSAGVLDPIRRPDLTNTYPAATIGPFPQWSEPGRIVSLDPWGHLVADAFKREIAEGVDIRPTIAVTRARLDLIEMRDAIAARRLKPDGKYIHENGTLPVVKVAIDPVWYLPGMAERFGTTETNLRRALFEQTAGMFPELVTRPDHARVPAADRRHDRLSVRRRRQTQPIRAPKSPAGCMTNATAPTCSAPTSAPAVLTSSTASRNAPARRQDGGLGVIVYNRKEGRALGEVTKFLVYNARKRQEGGDARRDLFRAHRMRRRRAGRAVPAIDAAIRSIGSACGGSTASSP